MVITGAGPGIMEAGIEGAGAEHSFGVSIRLPFEAATSQFIADDPKLVNFRYFFTRKLAFVKEADGFVLLPGGFGTLDEAFELLTLVQTGKAQPGPIVLLDVPGGTYWQTWQRVRRATSSSPGATSSENDLSLVRVTDDVDVAVDEIDRLLRQLPLAALRRRPARAPDAHRAAGRHELDRLNDEFADIVDAGPDRADRGGTRPRSPTTTTSTSSGSRFRFDRHGWAPPPRADRPPERHRAGAASG